MKNTKKQTFVYKAFGFPIKLINVPMKRVVGEWVIDVDFVALEKAILRLLIHKRTPLSGAELRFIRKFLEMTTTEFGKLFDVSHVAVLKWEGGKTRPPISTDIYIRLHVLDQLRVKDKEFRDVFDEAKASTLTRYKKKKPPLLSINIDEDLESA
ncbi:MAG: hypothetical protein K1000chlam2_01478 [Chlamydiae bacterium]|nr:hypothetical protein [Chlamydiota bacterium]